MRRALAIRAGPRTIGQLSRRMRVSQLFLCLGLGVRNRPRHRAYMSREPQAQNSSYPLHRSRGRTRAQVERDTGSFFQQQQQQPGGRIPCVSSRRFLGTICSPRNSRFLSRTCSHHRYTPGTSGSSLYTDLFEVVASHRILFSGAPMGAHRLRATPVLFWNVPPRAHFRLTCVGNLRKHPDTVDTLRAHEIPICSRHNTPTRICWFCICRLSKTRLR